MKYIIHLKIFAFKKMFLEYMFYIDCYMNVFPL